MVVVVIRRVIDALLVILVQRKINLLYYKFSYQNNLITKSKPCLLILNYRSEFPTHEYSKSSIYLNHCL